MVSSMVELREITKENYEAVLALHVSEAQTEFVPTVTEALAQAWVYKDTAYPFAVYADGEPVGFIMLGYYELRDQYTVWKFLIDGRYQQKGHGKAALRLAIAWLREKFGVPEVFLGCAHENRVAEKLYASVGFQRTGFETETGFEMRLEII